MDVTPDHEPAAASTPVNRYASAPAWRAVDAYFTHELVGEDEALVAARESGARTTMPNAEVAANQGALLGLLIGIAGARRVLEFGTLAGYSTIWCARAVGAQGRVTTLELEPQNAHVALENLERAGVADRVEVRIGPAAESAQHLIEEGAEPYDLVFIDADKPGNPAYLAAALRLTGPGAVIVIDNVVRDGAVVDAASEDPRVQGVRQVVQDIAEHPELEATALQTVGVKGWDGLLIARRR
ncbi:O-methyltransferase [Brachybacterium phenoliresistens]|uniref:O-methyltransferase n=1 Tax=Brachybacterium phenoliresistens TaxID=396014 RepID=UPI00337AD0C9